MSKRVKIENNWKAEPLDLSIVNQQIRYKE